MQRVVFCAGFEALGLGSVFWLLVKGIQRPKKDFVSEEGFRIIKDDQCWGSSYM